MCPWAIRSTTSCVEQLMTGSWYPRVGEELLLAGVIQPFGQQLLSFFGAFAACPFRPAEQLDELLVAAAFGVVDVGVQL